MPLLITDTTAPAAPAAADTAATTAFVENWSDLEVCVALYWARRFRRRDDTASAQEWTAHLDALLDWRLVHGPHVPLP